MQPGPIRIFLVLFILALIYPSTLQAATEQRIALVIGNSAYTSGPLKNPVNDATDIAAALKGLGFTVTLKTDADLRVMKDEIDNFGDSLKKGGVGLFFYAGHGIQVGGANYLIPVRAKISNEKMIEHEALDVNRLLSTLDNAGNIVNIVMLDACRDNPLARSFRNAGRGLAIISKTPPSTIISFSTGANQVAADGDGRNSPYTTALLQNIKTPGLPVEQVFKRVRNKLVDDTQGKQEPAEYTTLRGDFYFIPQGGRLDNLPDTTHYAAKTMPRPDYDELVQQKAALERERQELAREKQDMERQKALDAERKELEAERNKMAEEKKQLAMGSRPTVVGPRETARDGRFVAYDNGTVLDTSTNLMWAAKDIGSSISWASAKSYCENYRGGGYSDWRMPTQDELAGLYDTAKTYQSECRSIFTTLDLHLTELIRLTCYALWASETRGSEAAFFYFDSGTRNWYHQSRDLGARALPVRFGK